MQFFILFSSFSMTTLDPCFWITICSSFCNNNVLISQRAHTLHFPIRTCILGNSILLNYSHTNFIINKMITNVFRNDYWKIHLAPLVQRRKYYA